MEFIINILDSFPSLNKLTQKHNITLELNNKEYNLKKLIIQQEAISIKENLPNLLFKVYAILNNKKILIGINHINFDSLNYDDKSSIIWLEFKKKIEENKKEINDINLLFYDCIRLKIKIIQTKLIPKTDKKIKNNKSKLNLVSPNKQEKNNNKEKNNYIKDNNINVINSCRILNPSNNFLNSNLLKKKENKFDNVDENTIKNNGSKIKVLINEKIFNSILDKYQNLEIDPQKSISQECMKDLIIENDCILTDNNIFENYSYSTSLGDNLKKKNFTNIKKIENHKEKNNNINFIEIKNNNANSIIHNSIISPNKLNNIIKNILKNSNEEHRISNKINGKDSSFNNMEIIKENETFNNNSNSVRRLKAHHKKNKSFNKIEYNKKNNNGVSKKLKSNSKPKFNIKNKNNDINNNTSLSKENLINGCYTLNDFYNCKNIKNKINENTELEKNNKDISLKEIKLSSIEENTILTDLLISKKIKTNYKRNIEKNKEIISEDEKARNNEFLTFKKDYDLFYTSKFIKNIKNDLLDLEFNLAIDKSISLFILYYKEVNILYNNKKELMESIKNYTNKIEEENKKLSLLNNKKMKFEFKEKNKKLIKNSFLDIKSEILNQKKIFENIINNKISKKQKLKSILSLIIKIKPSL